MFRTLCTFVCLAIAIGQQKAVAFTVNRSELCAQRRSSALRLHKLHDRRTFLARNIVATAIISSATTVETVAPNPAFAAALLTDKSSPDVRPFAGGASEARRRFRLAIRDVDDLLADYDVITKGGAGDNVRLYLGTQGVKSNMYGITKVLKSLREEAEDVVEYTEALNEFEAYLFQAEGAAYQSMFVEHSSAKSTPESLLRTARGDIVNMRKFMGDLALQLNLET